MRPLELTTTGQNRVLAPDADQRCPGEADLLLGVCGWQARCTKEPAARRSSVVLRAGTPGVLGANDVEPVKRVHKRFQEARSGSSVQGDGQVGRISQSIACMIPAVPLTVCDSASGIRSPSLSTDLVQPTSSKPVFWIASRLPTTRPNIPARPHDTVLAADYTSRISKRWMSPFCIWKTWITILSTGDWPLGHAPPDEP
jgi:hypothetical protein